MDDEDEKSSSCESRFSKIASLTISAPFLMAFFGGESFGGNWIQSEDLVFSGGNRMFKVELKMKSTSREALSVELSDLFFSSLSDKS